MARTPKPWWYSRDGQWAVTIRGSRYLLGADKEAANDRFHELMKKPPMKAGSLWALHELYLQWLEQHRAPLTVEWYKRHLRSFLTHDDKIKDMPANQLLPLHVENWVDSHKDWGDSYKRGAMTAVDACMNWAVKKNLLDRNPIKGRLDKPRPGKRDVVLSAADFKNLLKHLDGDFRLLVLVAWKTGARPQELTKVCARHVDLENARWVFPANEAKGHKERYVYLTKTPLSITKKLMKKRPKGPLFRRNGTAWDRFMVADEFKKLKEEVGVKYRLYDMRHSFITNALKRGVDPITLQHLVGHKDLSMISKIYAKVQQDVGHMRRAAARAVQ